MAQKQLLGRIWVAGLGSWAGSGDQVGREKLLAPDEGFKFDPRTTIGPDLGFKFSPRKALGPDLGVSLTLEQLLGQMCA